MLSSPLLEDDDFGILDLLLQGANADKVEKFLGSHHSLPFDGGRTLVFALHSCCVVIYCEHCFLECKMISWKIAIFKAYQNPLTQ